MRLSALHNVKTISRYLALPLVTGLLVVASMTAGKSDLQPIVLDSDTLSAFNSAANQGNDGNGMPILFKSDQNPRQFNWKLIRGCCRKPGPVQPESALYIKPNRQTVDNRTRSHDQPVRLENL